MWGCGLENLFPEVHVLDTPPAALFPAIVDLPAANPLALFADGTLTRPPVVPIETAPYSHELGGFLSISLPVLEVPVAA